LEIKQLAEEICLDVKDTPMTREQIFFSVGHTDISLIDEALYVIHDKLDRPDVRHAESLNGFDNPFPVIFWVYYKKLDAKC
jgi:hypothetical protein